MHAQKKSVDKLNLQKKELLESSMEEYSIMTSDLEHVSNMFEARKYVLGFGERFAITGFTAEDDVQKLENTFKDLDKVEIEIKPPYNDKRLSPPTKLKTPPPDATRSRWHFPETPRAPDSRHTASHPPLRKPATTRRVQLPA